VSNPIELKITLDLDRHLAGEAILDNDGDYVGTGPTTLEDVVLGMVADKLAHRAARDAESGYPSLRDRVKAIRDEAIRAKVEPAIEEALTAPIRRTNTYGEPVGEETTLRDVIADQVTKQLKVTNARSGFDDSTLTKFIREEVQKALKADLKKELDRAKAAVLSEVQSAGAEVIADTLKRAAGRF
jgi:hypothetical protein